MPQIGDTPYGILIAGLGGTGVVTICAILGMAAHLEGKGCGVIDMAGLAQKGGAVYCHVKIGRAARADVHAIRIAAGEADLMLGCDLVVAGTPRCSPRSSRAKPACSSTAAEVFPGDIARNPDFVLPSRRSSRRSRRGGESCGRFCRHDALGEALLGDFHRRQYLHSRLCLAEGLSAAFGRSLDARDRAQRRIRGDE